MPLKSCNVKIPLPILSIMEDRGDLNPEFMARFLNTYMYCEVPDKKIEEFTTNYTFKVEANLHKSLKLQAIKHNIAMNELGARLLKRYY